MPQYGHLYVNKAGLIRSMAIKFKSLKSDSLWHLDLQASKNSVCMSSFIEILWKTAQKFYVWTFFVYGYSCFNLSIHDPW